VAKRVGGQYIGNREGTEFKALKRHCLCQQLMPPKRYEEPLFDSIIKTLNIKGIRAFKVDQISSKESIVFANMRSKTNPLGEIPFY